jgi:cytochrome P450
LYLLTTHPDKLARLREELDGVVPDNVENMTYESIRELPYLEAVVNETLRLYPVAGEGAMRIVPKGGREIAGHFVPEGVSNHVQRLHVADAYLIYIDTCHDTICCITSS